MSGIEAPEGEDHDGRAAGKIAWFRLLPASTGALPGGERGAKGKKDERDERVNRVPGEPLNKSALSALRLKSGMIIRRATLVVARTTRCRGAQRHGSLERCLRGPAKRGSSSGGMSRPREEPVGAFASRYGVASSFGRHCSALRGRTIRVVAFRASHPAKPPSRQRRFVQRFPKEKARRRITAAGLQAPATSGSHWVTPQPSSYSVFVPFQLD
ncbi:hypothetical protein SAMN05216299_11313 [Nitrosospira sp. Nsp14]|nr:hypothetical protein SAMN05216299_11313 [Nitrosospira sp. Nsp14]